MITAYDYPTVSMIQDENLLFIEANVFSGRRNMQKMRDLILFLSEIRWEWSF